MNQRTHTWLAIRAIALLEDSKEASGLVSILRPHLQSAAIGSWIPDLADSKRGSGDIDNHVMKMKPYNGSNKSRFVKGKKALFKSLGKERLLREFIEKWGGVLGADWWNKPYKAVPAPGQHLANRSMALTTTLIDQLILGDPEVAKLVPGSVRFADKMNKNARARAEEVATYCFMLSHFIADSCQPCHCDARSLTAYSNGLHKEMESHWSKKVGTYFEKKKLLKCKETQATILDKARKVDETFDLSFKNIVPTLRERDTWLEVINLCRASFAVSSIIVPPQSIPYGSKELTTFEDVFEGANSDPELLADINRAIMHDAVLNIAIIWKEVWGAFS